MPTGGPAMRRGQRPRGPGRGGRLGASEIRGPRCRPGSRRGPGQVSFACLGCCGAAAGDWVGASPRPRVAGMSSVPGAGCGGPSAGGQAVSRSRGGAARAQWPVLSTDFRTAGVLQLCQLSQPRGVCTGARSRVPALGAWSTIGPHPAPQWPLSESGVSCTFRSQIPSPCSSTSSASHQLPALEGKAGLYLSSLDSSIDILKKRAQDLIENINENRQKDHALMTNFRDSLKMKVSDLTEKLEDRMYQAYSQHSKVIQDRLQEFTLKMTQISHLETELKQACRTVETVYRDLCVPPEVGTSLREAL
nr:synaptonemal complex central element protein 2 [Cavia porcellus]